jgi:hypothetical protein
VERTKKTTAVAVAAGVLVLGAGVGAASLASADPTATPSASPSLTASPTPGTPAPDKRGGPDGRHGLGGPGLRGPGEQELATTLASKLGVTQAKVTAALKAFRDENKPTAKPTPGTPKPDPAARDAALAKALATKLGVDEAKVKAALTEIRATGQADRAAVLKTKLDAAVKTGTLTQAEADAVTKAVDKGVINVGPR